MLLHTVMILAYISHKEGKEKVYGYKPVMHLPAKGFLTLPRTVYTILLYIPLLSSHNMLFSSQLLDLCILDINSLEFKYGVLAAAAFCHFISFEDVQKVSGEHSF